MNLPTFRPFGCLLGMLALLETRALGAAADDTIHSSVEGTTQVAVTATGGVFVAPRTGGPWRPILHSDSMPLPGVVVGNPDPDGALFHYAVRAFQPAARRGDPAEPLPAPSAWRYGLYRRTAAGTGWERVSEDLGFVQVLTLGNRLFAVTQRPDKPAEGQRILESADGGVTWKALPEIPDAVGSVQRLFPDPEAPDRPVAFAVGLRGSVLRLTGDPRRWQGTAPNRLPPAFRAEIGYDGALWTWSGVPFTRLRLQNFFEFHPKAGAGAESVPTAWIGVGGRREFKPGADVVVVARIRTGPEFPAGPRRQFVDSGDDRKAWGFRRWTPSGTLEEYPPPGLSPDPTARVTVAACKSDSEPGVLVSLSSRAPFDQPGRYRVQLVYDTVDASRTRPNEWAVRLLSDPFEIEVK